MNSSKEIMKIKSIHFGDNNFRKFKNILINFSDRLTLIAGHNAIGKSTILGLIASASGLTSENCKNYFGNNFHHDINDIINFEHSELESKSLSSPWPRIEYEFGKKKIYKNLRLTFHQPSRLRSVPETASDSPNPDLATQSGKVQIPTIYLGMTRMLPIGETNPDYVICQEEKMHDDDKDYLIRFINSVISGTASETDKNITEQSVKNTKKVSSHPKYPYDARSISLGQDSLSSIATAIASFNKVKRELGDKYKGGLLVIDEIDAGFHPKAQYKLIDALCHAARSLSLQIIATTHSTSLIEYVHPDSTKRNNKYRTTIDSVVYLTGTKTPLIPEWSLKFILADMSLSDPEQPKKKQVPVIKAYLEDDQATEFLKGILQMQRNTKQFSKGQKKKLQLIPIGVGGSNIIQLPKHDEDFKKKLLIVDADTYIGKDIKNAIKLPSVKNKSYNPEKTIYEYITELIKGTESQFANTYKALINNGISQDKLKEDFINKAVNIDDRVSSKKWFNSVLVKLKQYKIFEYWKNDHPQIMGKFMESLEDKLELLRQSAENEAKEL